MKKLLTLLATTALLCGCGIYSFTGTSIQPDVKTVEIPFVEYKAPRVNPSLSNDLTEAIKTKFRRLTRLEVADMDGDLLISAAIVGYDVRATAVTSNEVAAQNRLTITLKADFTNKKYPKDDFTGKTFSAYADYDSNNSLEAVESTLCTEIIDKLVEDLFNATVAQW